jgi:Gluconate 2-dehydrogenase subunit 3
MKRRHAIKSLATSLGALLTLPAWANSWTPQSVALSSPFLNVMQEDLLVDIVSTIIPEGEKPGAKSLGVPNFIQKMVVDCFDKKAQEDFKLGLDTIEKKAQQIHNQFFTTLTSAQKEEVLKNETPTDSGLRGVSNTDDTVQKEFFKTIKNLTIQGYTTSEYVMVNYYKYEMAPGHFYGCVPV